MTASTPERRRTPPPRTVGQRFADWWFAARIAFNTGGGALLAYLLIVGTAAFGFFQVGESQERDEQLSRENDYELCLTQQSGREGTRDTIRDIAMLGRDLAQGDPRLIAQFDAFEQRRLKALPPIDCPVQ